MYTCASLYCCYCGSASEKLAKSLLIAAKQNSKSLFNPETIWPRLLFDIFLLAIMIFTQIISLRNCFNRRFFLFQTLTHWSSKCTTFVSLLVRPDQPERATMLNCSNKIWEIFRFDLLFNWSINLRGSNLSTVVHLGLLAIEVKKLLDIILKPFIWKL